MDIVAAYFPGWKSPAEVSWFAPSPWVTTPANNIFMGEYKERYPLYGATNEDQQWVIDLHLKDAETARITAFAVCWYNDEHSNYALKRMKESTSSSAVKFCVLWANHYPRLDPKKATIGYLLDGVRRAAVHSQNARCYRKNGRPVFIIYSADHLDDVIRAGRGLDYVPTQAEVDVLSVQIKAAFSESGEVPYLVLQSNDARWQSASGVDATTAYAVRFGNFNGAQRLAHSYAELRTVVAQFNTSGFATAAANRKGFWPVLMAGRDERPWGGTDGDADADNCEPTKAEFMGACSDSFSLAKADAYDQTVFMYAWNELGEGGYVIPTAGIGYSRINAMLGK